MLRRSKKLRPVELILFGGLGNQLFQYFAALYLAHNLGTSLKIDSTFSQLNRTGHSDWINALNLSATISGETPRHSARYVIALFRRAARGALARMVRSGELQLKLLNKFRSNVVGYDPNLELISKPVTITGYFQTWRYYQALRDRNLAPRISIEHPTPWFTKMEEAINAQGRVLGIHVRRGDYFANPEIGVLSSSYYKDCLQTLSDKGVVWDAIWIFSDDISLAKQELGPLFSVQDTVFFVDPPSNSHSFESLALMSLTTTLIMANSTFSWWAATLGNTQKIVVCPSKWFAQVADPMDLYPPHWHQVPSAWLTPNSPLESQEPQG
jgi:hypothetical protein